MGINGHCLTEATGLSPASGTDLWGLSTPPLQWKGSRDTGQRPLGCAVLKGHVSPRQGSPGWVSSAVEEAGATFLHGKICRNRHAQQPVPATSSPPKQAQCPHLHRKRPLSMSATCRPLNLPLPWGWELPTASQGGRAFSKQPSMQCGDPQVPFLSAHQPLPHPSHSSQGGVKPEGGLGWVLGRGTGGFFTALKIESRPFTWGARTPLPPPVRRHPDSPVPSQSSMFQPPVSP